MYFKIMNILCFGAIGYLLSANNIDYNDFSFWAIFVLVIIIQLLPIVYLNDDTTK